MPDLVFPDGFLWGAATSAHQTEGGNANTDWWEWEQAGRVPASGRAADSWHRWREDLDVAESLGLGVVRISAEWARIEPEPGRYDDDAIEHYVEVLREAKARGFKTMLVLWHFTNPLWIAERGDWMSPDTIVRFAAYARLMADRLGDIVDFWATINEANTYVWRGYVVGIWPPGYKDAWPRAYRAYRGLAEGHRQARAAIKQVLGESASIGLTHVLAWPHPAEKHGTFSAPLCAWWNLLANTLFLDMVSSEHMDWLGVQYYHDSPARVVSIADDDGRVPRTDMGWRIVPRGMYEVAMIAWRRYRVPILVTENGLADAADRQRGRFIVDHLSWLHRAIAEGADVRGYLHWSLIDNFEWAHGFEPRFGLAAVDYETLTRRIRPSARLFAEIVAENRIRNGLGATLTYADGTQTLAPEGSLGSKG